MRHGLCDLSRICHERGNIDHDQRIDCGIGAHQRRTVVGLQMAAGGDEVQVVGCGVVGG